MNQTPTKENLIKLKDWLWEIPLGFRSDMKVPARLYALESMLTEISQGSTLWQLVNLTTLPGIYKYAVLMPDAHEGYGSPIGGVAAIDIESGVISPGMCGYDINCGVRILKSNLFYEEIKPYLEKLTYLIYSYVPSGVGRGGKFRFSKNQLKQLVKKGVGFAKNYDFFEENDLENCESNGFLENAEPDFVSLKALDRGKDQLGTIGAGNHFVEIQKVQEIFDQETSQKFGLAKEQITVMVHCGSRGFGHQIATDYIRTMNQATPKYGINLPDRELAAAPFNSKEGQEYFGAMATAANFAWLNRQFISQEIRQAWQKIFPQDKLELIYDVAHNIIKTEIYDNRKLIIHRKGATRAFPKNNSEIPKLYQKIGQPVLIPGSMGTASYILVGQKAALEQTFGSTCHGAGRAMSRTQAKKKIRGSELKQNLEKQGISIAAGSMSGLAEEAPQAYKDVNRVVGVVEAAGLAKKVVKLKPIGVIKG